MNDFVALLLAAAAFCLAFAAFGLAGRLGVLPHGLAEGSLLQLAVAGAVACAAWRRARASATPSG